MVVSSWLANRSFHPAFRPAAYCFFTRCTCAALDDKQSSVHYPMALSAADVDAVLALARRIGARRRPRHRAFGVERDSLLEGPKPLGHRVTFLQSEFREVLPQLYARLLAFAARADEVAGWGMIDPRLASARTIELLDYSDVGERGSSLGWHTDQQSSITQLVMLSNPTEFEGGVLQLATGYHDEPGLPGHVEEHSLHLKRGDLAVYRSQQQHHVSALRGGRRLALTIEWWHVQTPDAIRLAPSRAHHRAEYVVELFGGCPM
jgi:hypothetical protein